MLSDEEVQETMEWVHVIWLAPLIFLTFTCWVAYLYFGTIWLGLRYCVNYFRKGKERRAKKKRR